MASNTKTRAALYARVSTTGHGQNVELQLNGLRQVAQARGWSVFSRKGMRVGTYDQYLNKLGK